ncbi:MAG TPA: hypothetical protein VGH31_08140 [Acidimicrobiales bacterium]
MAVRRSTHFRIAASVAALLGASGLLFATSGLAGAAGSTSPPAGSVPTSCSVSSTLTLPVSGTPVSALLSETCTFAVGSAVSFAYGSSSVAPVTAGSNGLITVNVSAKDPQISFNGGSYLPAVFGVNTLTATGLNSSGGTNTATFLIDLVQGSASNTNSNTNSNSGGSSSGSTGSSGTGSTSSSSGGLAFTGADLALLIAAAVALILLGGGVIMYTRRRTAQHSPKS